jgi:hypothetical protein
LQHGIGRRGGRRGGSEGQLHQLGDPRLVLEGIDGLDHHRGGGRGGTDRIEQLVADDLRLHEVQELALTEAVRLEQLVELGATELVALVLEGVHGEDLAPHIGIGCDEAHAAGHLVGGRLRHQPGGGLLGDHHPHLGRDLVRAAELLGGLLHLLAKGGLHILRADGDPADAGRRAVIPQDIGQGAGDTPNPEDRDQQKQEDANGPGVERASEQGEHRARAT